MIAEKQLKKALTKVITKLLKKGTIPSKAEMLDELKKEVPFPGKPKTRSKSYQNFTKVNTSEYNNFWNSVSADLTLLYDQLYDHISGTAYNLERVFSWASGINAAAVQLQSYIDNFISDDRSIDKFSLSFGDSTFIDLGADEYGPKTTAYIDYKNGAITLPVNTNSFSRVSLSLASISGKPNTGKEQQIIGNSITNLLNDSTNIPWMTQVIDSGGGSSYTIVLTFLKPISLSSCEVETTHKQTVELSYKLTTGTWTPMISSSTSETLPSSITAIKIILTRDLGIPSGDKFIYTFGINSINLRSQSYTKSATYTSTYIPISTLGRKPSKIEFATTEYTPAGTGINYNVSLYNNSLNLVETDDNVALADNAIIKKDVPFYLATAFKNACPVRYSSNTLSSITTATTQVNRPGITLFKKRLVDVLGDNVSSDYNMLAEGNGVFVGECQWTVDYYENDLSNLPAHIPGPADWENLSENGFSKDEITTVFSDINRSTDSVIMIGEANGQIVSWNLKNINDFAYDYLTWEFVVTESTVTITLKKPNNTSICSGSMDLADISVGKINTIELTGLTSYDISGAVIIRSATTNDSGKLFILTNRLDVVRGPIPDVGFTDKTVYRYTTNVYSDVAFSITVPGKISRYTDSRFSTLYGNVDDISIVPAHQYDENGANGDLFATVYLNDKRLVKSQTGLTYNFIKGWNSLTIYIYCAKQRSAPFTLGISLTPKTYMLTDNSLVTNTGTLTDLGIEYPLLDNVTMINGKNTPQTNITRTIAKKDRLQATSIFDLCWNTPILYKDRYTGEFVYDTDLSANVTNVYMPYTETGRYAVYYDSVQASANTETIAYCVITATLTTSSETTTSRPVLKNITAKII